MIAMANNTYVIDDIAQPGETVTVTDDGTGSDWLVMEESHLPSNQITLSWTVDQSFNATSASGSYSDGGSGGRVIVNGQIENVRGSNGSDFISGNQVANILYGDAAATGAGGDDQINAGSGNDTGYGGAGNDYLGGGDGQDWLYGGVGIDSILGNDGIDTIVGGAGPDELNGGSEIGDTLDYSASTAGIKLTLTYNVITTGEGGDAKGDQVFGFTDIIGTGFDDTLTDSIKSTLDANNNKSEFYGGNGHDKLTLGGGNDRGAGGSGNDTLLGGDGKDTLTGDANNDTLTGGNGADVQTGGTGADIFIFNSRAESRVALTGQDRITDFDREERDKLDLSAIDADSTVAGLQDFRFIGTGAFTGVEGQLRYQVLGGDATVSADVNGDRKADFAILLQDVNVLTQGDFIL
jgi:serralysin